jgi:hypothetical protein
MVRASSRPLPVSGRWLAQSSKEDDFESSLLKSVDVWRM